MRWFNEQWTQENIAAYLKRQAAMGTYGGIVNPITQRYCDACQCAHRPSGTIMILTRDMGMHSCGWWKNPDYERCLHLSLSFRDPKTGVPRSRDRKLSDEWIDAVFGPLKTLIWTEPPYYPEGKKNDTWHYRVFFAPDWAAPILPRGEVYSKDWTPADWLSWSDLRAKLHQEKIKMEGLPT